VQTNENKLTARRYFEEICNQGNFAVVDELLSPNIVFENPPAHIEGVEAFKQLITTLRTAFPDFQFTIEDEIAEGAKVVTRWRLRGTQRGEFQGNPATHKSFDVTGIDIFQVVAGKIERVWVNMDLLGQAQR
jgi:steroid delta-isomerase-like uncharacterized protein